MSQQQIITSPTRHEHSLRSIWNSVCFLLRALCFSHRVVTADVWREEAVVRRHEAAIFDFIVVIKVFKFPTTNVANIEIKATILRVFTTFGV